MSVDLLVPRTCLSLLVWIQCHGLLFKQCWQRHLVAEWYEWFLLE